jgi:hypothetical protein
MIGDAASVEPTAATLAALVGERHRLLIRTLTDGQAFDADGQASEVHHREHVAHALLLVADEIADRAIGFAERHHTCRRRVNTHLVFDTDTGDVVAAPIEPSASTKNFGTMNTEIPRGARGAHRACGPT